MVSYGGRYVEPSIRPDDSRYGENPNRLQRHTQFQVNFSFIIWSNDTISIASWSFLILEIILAFDDPHIYFTLYFLVSISYQVILKPDPGNSQDLFIRSLAALGSCLTFYYCHNCYFHRPYWNQAVFLTFFSFDRKVIEMVVSRLLVFLGMFFCLSC